MSKPRIVSLIASATEIVCALGLEEHLVGRSHECDFPASVTQLAVCTEPKFNVEGSSAEIDRRVKDVLKNDISVYRIHTDVLKSLRPDVIVTQVQCAVCAVSERDVARALADWNSTPPRVVPLNPNSLADVWNDIKRVGVAVGESDRADVLISALKRRMDDIADRARRLPVNPTVACIEWIEPLMAAGHWMPELIQLAGGHDVFGQAGKHAPPITWERLRETNPDVIFMAPCGLDLARTRREMPALARQPGWSEMRAVRDRRVFVADGNQYFNRPGPRLAESLEILGEVIHPTEFRFGHEGTGWERWASS